MPAAKEGLDPRGGPDAATRSQPLRMADEGALSSNCHTIGEKLAGRYNRRCMVVRKIEPPGRCPPSTWTGGAAECGVCGRDGCTGVAAAGG